MTTMPPEPTLADFIRYNTWANQALLGLCGQLSEAQLASDAPGAYGSIRATFEHMLRAEADYVGRMTGSEPKPAFEWKTEAPLSELAAFAGQTGEAMLRTVQRTPPLEMVHESADGFHIQYQARVLFLQMIIHGVEHRTNITTLLSQWKMTLPELDAWGLMWTHQDEFAVKEWKDEPSGPAAPAA
jgi:uncharacterized damage-inducible protein DinB